MIPQIFNHPNPLYYESNPSYYDFSENGPARFNLNHYMAYPVVYESDEFRMYGFKIQMCSRNRRHDWTQCPFAHRGEKAKRRDPRRYNYAGVPCPDFQDGSCIRGETCQYSHGVFEYWLHPDKYRTRPCNAGASCQRRVCFFAHSDSELRPDPHSNYLIVYPTQPEREHIVGSEHILYPAPPKRENIVGSGHIVSPSQHERGHILGSCNFEVGASSSSLCSKPQQTIKPLEQSEVTTDFLTSMSGLQINENKETQENSRFLKWFLEN